MKRIEIAALLVFAIGGTSCTIGKDSLLFVTDTTVGVDLDSVPATMDLAYARNEMVLGPVFEENQVLPVLSSVGVRAGAFDFGANHSFATGDSAVVMANALTDPGKADPADYGVRGFQNGGIIKTSLKVDERERLFFGTKTVLGASVQWTSSTVPDAVNIGFKRKELACVPLIEKETGTPGETEVKLSSLIATADAGVLVGGRTDTGLRVGQLFATGEAATALSRHGAVRSVLGPAIIPNYDEAVRLSDSNPKVRTRRFLVRASVYSGLKGMKEDAVAQGWVSQLAGLAAPANFDFDQYKISGLAGSRALGATAQGAALGSTGFEGLADYRAQLAGSINVLSGILAGHVKNVDVDAVTGAAGTNAEKAAKLNAILVELSEKLDEFDRTWEENETIAGATLYFMTGQSK